MSAVSYAEHERSRGVAIWILEVADLGFTLKRGDAAANCRADNLTYTPSIVYDGLGDVFGQRQSFSTNELRQYPDGMREILICKANRGCSPVTTRSGSNGDVTFRTTIASCKKRIRSWLRS
jgi:hypothetical protein